MSEYDQLSKGQSRSAYTRRILEIVANIQKQKEDIGRILADTRKVRHSRPHIATYYSILHSYPHVLVYKHTWINNIGLHVYKYIEVTQ